MEQRKYPRFEVKLDVKFENSDESISLISENLSLGGVFLVSENEMANVGDEVTLAISVPGADGTNADTALLGKVMHSVPPLGLGVSFDWDRSSDEAKVRLESFLKRLQSLASIG